MISTLYLSRSQLGFAGGAGRRVLRIDPFVPDRVHLGKVLHVIQPDDRLQQLRLVGAGRLEQPVDGCENVRRLLRNRLAVAYLAGEVYGVAIDHGLGHARADFDTTDGHQFFSCDE